MSSVQVQREHNRFNEWMAKVNAALVAMCGLTADDLPDYCYADAFEDGESPKATARRAMAAARE